MINAKIVSRLSIGLIPAHSRLNSKESTLDMVKDTEEEVDQEEEEEEQHKQEGGSEMESTKQPPPIKHQPKQRPNFLPPPPPINHKPKHQPNSLHHQQQPPH